MGKTLFDKIWESHIVVEKQNEPALIYIDRHLVHEVTSPQAFDGLRMNGRKVRRPDLTIATMDHNVPTSDRSLPILDQTSAVQIKTLENNCKDFGIKLFDINSPNQGIVHVIGPQLGIISDVGASWLIPNLLGRARANGMALLGEDIDSNKALNWGLVYEVIPDDELKQKAIEYAIQLANGAITGLKAIVRAHDNALNNTLNEQLDYERDTQRVLCDGDVFKEGVTAFIQKRKPNFRDIE